MVAKPRIRCGLPRGGIGYLGLPIGAAALLLAWRSSGASPLVIASLSIPLCLWLGLGLIADGRVGEMADEVIWESARRNDLLRVEDNIVTRFRLSTWIILLGLASLIVALWR